MYNWKKDIVQWRIKDTLYLSVVFSWQVEEAERIAWESKCKVVMGGPALNNGQQMIGVEPLLFHNPLATFTSRGCPRKCGFCIVPQIEGDFRELKDFRIAPVVCDNNFLESSMAHIENTVDKLSLLPFVDFNQGLDARLFSKEKAQKLGELNCKVRFAFDSFGYESAVKDAVDLAKKYTSKDINIYCLIGYKDTPESARERLELVRSWGIKPNPMRYQPLDATIKNSFVHKDWSEGELKKTMRYYSRLNYLEHIPFEEYNVDKDQGKLF